MVEGISGSSPDWHAANMKTKGRAIPSEVPPSLLGGSATGLASWSVTNSPPAAIAQKSRRHFHSFEVAQTTARDCLPCVGATQKDTALPTANATSSSSPVLPSTTLARSNQPLRRHRRQVPAPPCTDRPQGKRMLQAVAPHSICKSLLQDPQPTQHPNTSMTAAAAQQPPAAGVNTTPTAAITAAHSTAPLAFVTSLATAAATAPPPAVASTPYSPGHEMQNISSDLNHAQGSRPCSSSSSSGNSHVGSSSRPSDRQLLKLSSNSAGVASCLQSAAEPAVQDSCRQRGKKGGRVEDDPNYFRTPKDPPTLQRFAASLAQLSQSQGSGLTTVQRHEAGIRAKQQAQLTAAAREVAALDAGPQPDVH